MQHLKKCELEKLIHQKIYLKSRKLKLKIVFFKMEIKGNDIAKLYNMLYN